MTKPTIKLSPYTRVTLTIWAVSIAAVGGGYLLFYLPQKTELAQIQKQCAETQRKLEKVHQVAQAQTKEKMKQRCDESSRLISAFSTEHDKMTKLVFQIGQIANELHLAEFSSKNEKGKERPTVADSKALDEGWLEVDFSAATFRQFAEFINRLERHCPVVFVEEISFRRKTSGSKGHAASLRLSFLAEKNAGDKTVAMAAD